MLTDAMVLTLARAGAYLANYAAALSDFEVETVASVGQRFLQHGREANTTPEEWAVIDQAVAAMEAEAAVSVRGGRCVMLLRPENPVEVRP